MKNFYSAYDTNTAKADILYQWPTFSSVIINTISKVVHAVLLAIRCYDL
ncbi:hypothetical protein Q4493_11040 [Colwellia sp. 1_MG-2023]|nr:hypothetical protein [Colwellia sp. 1_MG-2023]